MRLALLAALAFSISGCVLQIPLIKPVGRPLAAEESQPSPQSGGRELIGLAASGGGNRAAYLEAAVLREIHRLGLRVEVPGAPAGDLLSQLGFISSVSGGSMSSAYYAMHHVELETSPWTSAAWAAYTDLMASNNRWVQFDLRGELNPWTWILRFLTNYNRGDVARGFYERKLFGQATIAQLPDRPALFVNATNVTHHNHFVFAKRSCLRDDFDDQPTTPVYMYCMDDLRLDPASIKLAEAVYASSAFPFVFPNLELADYGYNGYLHEKPNTVLLGDGGLLDNSGLVMLLSQFERELARFPEGRFVLVISVDADVGFFQIDQAWAAGRKRNREVTRHNVVGEGRNSLDASYDYIDTQQRRYLARRGVDLPSDDPGYDEVDLARAKAAGPLPFWAEQTATGRLLRPPKVIDLSLPQLLRLTAKLIQEGSNRELTDRLAKVGITADPITVYSALADRLAAITTDFRLRKGDREVLDLCAYILVNHVLKPQLETWSVEATRSLEAAR